MAVRISQLIIEAHDPKKTQKFYADLGFKFELTMDKKGVLRKKNGKKARGQILAVFKLPKTVTFSSNEFIALVIQTDNLDATLARVEKKWPNCFVGPIDTDTVGTRTVLMLDPGGHKIFLIEPAPIEKKKK